MFSIVLWMGCSEPSEPQASYQTTQTVEDTGGAESNDTGAEDTDTISHKLILLSDPHVIINSS